MKRLRKILDKHFNRTNEQDLFLLLISKNTPLLLVIGYHTDNPHTRMEDNETVYKRIELTDDEAITL